LVLLRLVEGEGDVVEQIHDCFASAQTVYGLFVVFRYLLGVFVAFPLFELHQFIVESVDVIEELSHEFFGGLFLVVGVDFRVQD
jgi:hypothetical protein